MAYTFSKLATSIDPRPMCGSPANTPGYSRMKIDHVVIHHNATTNKQTALNTWLTTGPAQTSAHYEVTPNEIIGCVEEERSAWQAGTSNMNRRSIGIEHLNSTLGPKWEVAEATLKNSARLCADICKRYGIPIDSAHIIPHKAVVSTACPGGINMAHYIDLVKQAAGQKATASNPASKPAAKPAAKTTESHSGVWFKVPAGATAERGTYVNGDTAIKVRYDSPSTSAPAVADALPPFGTFEYDSFRKAEGYTWIHHMFQDRNIWVPVRIWHGSSSTPYGTFK